MKKYFIGIFIIFMVFIGCQNLGSNQNTLEFQMDQEFDALLPFLNEKDVSKITYYNLEKGYMISKDNGLQIIDLGKEDKNGIVRYENGQIFRPSSLVQTSSTRNPQYASYRLVKSTPYKSFRGIQSNVLTPQYPVELVGIDQINEAAYDYLGAERNPTSVCSPTPVYGIPTCVPGSTTTGPGFSFEGGIYINSSHNAEPYVSVGGAYSFYPQLPWTYSLYPSGSEYKLRIYIPVDNKIEFQFTNVYYNLSRSWVFTVSGARINGNNMIYRRNSALLADPILAKSLDNRWTYPRLLSVTGNSFYDEAFASQYSNIGSTQSIGTVTVYTLPGGFETVDLQTP